MAERKRGTNRKMYSLSDDDLELISKIKKRALNNNYHLTDSLLIRMALRALNELPDKKILHIADTIPRPLAGRPSSL